MRRHKVEKAGFRFGVTEALQGFELRWFDVHKDRAPATVSNECALICSKARSKHGSNERISTLTSGSEPSSGTQLSRVADRVGRLHQAHGEKRRALPSIHIEALKREKGNKSLVES
jgi:hypothetical protein